MLFYSTDVNECNVKNGGCSHKCTNTKGSYSCSCPDPELTLAPDGRNCVASGVSVKCDQNDMSITLPKNLLLGLSREHVTLRDVKCVAKETKTHFTLKTALTGCGTTARFGKGAVVYSNTVLEIPVKNDAIITRVREIEIPFSCYYKNTEAATAVGVQADTKKLVFDEDGKGKFTVALDLFADQQFKSRYTEKDYPVQVKLRQDLYFEASVKSKDKTLSVLGENCVATPTQDSKHATSYPLITNGCPVDETTNIMKSSVGTFRFTTESFKFIAKHPFLFVHCQIRVCDSTDPKSRCAQGCLRGDRRRRDVTTDDKIYSLAQGPLTFYADEEDAGSTLSGKRKMPNLTSYNVFI
ncbi:unnamed protein product [Pocillopora meandrina]|uniref:ZP domain-containing protein n=1 Tax=Pocillopora meandrina TaxID=46732 RepID=A0AAU9WT73_9CNID|nr:unnamed protein product [Pocillopora meandrina]